MPEFKVSVGGDIAPITKTLQELKGDLKVLKLELEHATDPVSVAKLNAELKKTEDEIKRIKGIGPIITPDAKRGIDQATNSVTNLGRVVQDAPFGFIGIANNLNPLLESFQRLRAETGSNKAAMQALGSSLLGAGGLGLAISLASSALVLFGDKLFKSSKEAENLKKKSDELNQAINSAFASTAKEAAQVGTLVAVLRNETETRERRLAAIKQLQNISPEIFKNLKLEGDAVTGLDQAYTAFLANIKNVVAVRILQAKLESLIEQQIKKQGANLSGIDALGTLTATRKELERLQDIQKAGGIVNPAQIALLEGQVKKTERELSGLDKQINDIMKNIQALSPSVKVNTENKKEEDALKKRLALLERIKKSTKDTSELVQLQEQIFDLQVRIAARDDKKRLTQVEFDDLIRGFQDQLNEAFLNQATSLEASPKVKFSPIVDKLDFKEIIKKSFTTKIAPIEFTDSTGIVFKPGSVSVDVTDMKDRVAKATNLEKITITLHDVRVRLLGSKKTRLIEGVEEINKQLSEDIRSSLAGLQGDLFSTFGESLGEAFTNAISGQDIGEGLKNAARQMLSILGSVMQQIGKYVIAAAIKIQLLKKTLETWAVKNPALAVLAGIGLIAAGAALKNATFEGPKFAKGGIVTGPTIGLVGEAGKEAIIPLNKLPDMIGGRGQTNVVVKGSLSVKGRELVALLEQETSRFNRLV